MALPEWQLASLRRIQWRVFWILLLMYVVVVGAALAVHAVDKKPTSWSLVVVLPPLFASIVGVNMAYLRGVRDGKNHATDSEKKD